MATAKRTAKAAPVKKKAAAGNAAGSATKIKATASRQAAGPMKPIKESFKKSVEPRAVKAVMAALENTMVASINKKGAGSFVLLGLLKVTAVAVPAKKARKGINPFTKEETVFKARPASVKLKVRPLKKLKDAS